MTHVIKEFYGCHYTTTPKLAMDDLTAKAVIGADDLTLKTYSDRLLLPV
jgi:hypothetical protein